MGIRSSMASRPSSRLSWIARSRVAIDTQRVWGYSVFDHPSLASVNHLFDVGTPVGGNYEAAAPGALVGPPAKPRDDNGDIGDLFHAFSF
jgi:hypothetical protein